MNNIIKVLFYDPISRSGGGKAYIMNVIPKIKNTSQFDYHFYINRCFENQIELTNPFVKIHYSPKGTEQGGLKSFVKRHFFTKKEIDKINPDVIVFMNQIPTRFKVPTLLFLRNALYFIKKNNNYFGPISLKDRIRCAILKKVTLNSIRKSDLVLTSSESFSKTVMPYLSDAKSKVAVVAFGHNQNTLSNETRVPFSNSDNEINIVCLQYNFYKGIETAVKAMNDLIPKYKKIKLIITDNLETHADIRARMLWHEISANNLRDHIVTTGLLKQDELKNVYNKADIFIFPSFIESFGHGILEAMANGVPCILSDIEVFREIASDAALYFKPGNKEELCNCISRLINNVDERKKMVQRGIERVKLFTWEKHIKILEQILSSVLKTNETTLPESKNR